MLETPQRLRSLASAKKRLQTPPSGMINTSALKEKLVREMLELDKQREEMEIGASKVDFSMRQTYKEMIASRQSLLNQLSNELC
jgi:hypothetical protein